MPVFLPQGGSADRFINPEYKQEDVSMAKYEYAYPLNLDLKPGSKLHDDLVKAVLAKAWLSRNVMSGRYGSWREIDRTLTAYINPDWKARARNDRAKIEPVIIPVSYAVLETLMTYMVSAFLDYPIFVYEGVGPEDIIGAKLLEKCVEADCIRYKTALSLHTMLRDGFAYGLGVTSPQWSIRKRLVRKKQAIVPSLQSMMSLNEGDFEEEIIEGNKLYNIDVYQYLPDSDAPVHAVQDGESCGWVSRTNLMSLIEEERSGGQVFNIEYMRHIKNGMSSFYVTGKNESGRYDASGLGSTTLYQSVAKAVDVVNMYMNIIPEAWGLGSGKEPEKWLFKVAGDCVLIGAFPVGLNHQMFPVAINAPDFDGYSMSPISKLETTYGIQSTVDWLLQSHVANIKKSINDQIVVDPSLVNINDVKNPTAGKIIRKRRAAWGRGDVMDGIGQLKVTDVTAGFVGEISMLSDIIKYTAGASDSLQGIIQKRGERVSAEEAGGARMSALSRMQKMARITSEMAMSDIGYMFAYHTQQLMSNNTYVKTVGEWEQLLINEYGPAAARMVVRPRDLNVRFDVVPKDGSIPGGENAQTWVELYKVAAMNPYISAGLDMPRVFKHIARMLGAKDIEKFERIGAMQMPNEQVLNEADKGNLIPVQAAGQV